MRDLIINLEDRPGTAAAAAAALGNAGINIEGGIGMASNGTGMMHVLVADADAARSALQAAGIQGGGDREVEVMSIIDEPGELGRHLQRVADAGVNIDLMYLASNTRLVLGSPDSDGLRRALHSS